MSIEREVEHVVKGEDKVEETRQQKKARLAAVLDRGLTVDRLTVELPDDVYGEWVADDPSEIARMQSMGFEVDKTYASKRALHGSGSGESRVGDVIFMTTSAETKQLIDEIRKEKFIEMHGSKKDKRESLKEEREVETNSSLPVINESAASSVQGQEIAAQLFNKDS